MLQTVKNDSKDKHLRFRARDASGKLRDFHVGAGETLKEPVDVNETFAAFVQHGAVKLTAAKAPPPAKPATESGS